MKWKVTAILALVALTLLLIIVGAYLKLFGGWGLGSRQLSAPAVITEVKKLNQVVSIKYRLQRVVGLTEQRPPLGEESILLMVEGQAQAGIDLGQLKEQDVIQLPDGTIRLLLPPSELLNVFLDEEQTKVWDRHITWWSPWVAPDPDFEHRARTRALDDIRGAALKMGILEDADRNAASTVETFLQTVGVRASVRKRPS